MKSLSVKPTTYKKPNKKYRTGYLNRIEIFSKFDCLRVINKTKIYIKNEFKVEKLKKLENYFLSVKIKRRKGELENEILFYLKMGKYSIHELSRKLKLKSDETVRKKLSYLCRTGTVKKVNVGRPYIFYLSQSA